jgi:hypothetical protein
MHFVIFHVTPEVNRDRTLSYGLSWSTCLALLTF